MNVAVRAARLEDAEGIVAAHERASSELFEEVVGTPLAVLMPFQERLDECRRSLANVSEGDAEVLVAEDQGEIVGLAVWRREGREGELVDLHVVPEAWGTGVALELIAEAVAGLRCAGAEEAFLWVGEANPRARRFYEREGWRHDGTSRPSSLGPIELRYRLALSARPSSA